MMIDYVRAFPKSLINSSRGKGTRNYGYFFRSNVFFF